MDYFGVLYLELLGFASNIGNNIKSIYSLVMLLDITGDHSPGTRSCLNGS